MKYKINNSLMAFDVIDEGIILNVADNNLITIEKKEDIVIEIIQAFLEPKTYEEAYKDICTKFYVDKDDFNEAFEFMLLNNILKEYNLKKSILSDYQKMKYERQITSFHSLNGIEMSEAEKIQEKICNSTICIIGAGGIGSYLSLAMTMIGVEHIILIDFDKVELSNTARQILYDESDIGRYKTDVAKEKIKKYNKNVMVDTFNIHVKSADDLAFLRKYNLDLLVLCADTPRGEIQYIVDEVAHKNNVAWFYYGPYNHSQIFIGPMIIPQKTKNYKSIFPQYVSASSDKVKTINENFIASICDPYNGFASQFAAIEAFKYLSGIKKPLIINRKYYIDTDNWLMEYEDYV